MTARKVAAAAVCVGVLGLQVATMGWWWRTKSHYWPFMAYPMYSTLHSRGDRVTLQDVRVIPCDASAKARSVDKVDLRLSAPYFNRFLSEAVQGRPDSLRAQIEKWLPGRCRAEIWTRTYTIGGGGLELPGPPATKTVSIPLDSLQSGSAGGQADPAVSPGGGR